MPRLQAVWRHANGRGKFGVGSRPHWARHNLTMRLAIPLLLAGSAFGQGIPVCPRPSPGAAVQGPPELRSSNGVLRADFSLRTGVDVYGLTLYCYVDGNGLQSPTLRVRPGDEVILNLKNDLPATMTNAAPAHTHHPTDAPNPCGAGAVTASSTNLHFHGLSVPPVCHQDEVIHTLIQPGDAAFEYRIKIPPAQPPGLYWYHPHPHGFTERQVLGGASGALIVEGIERVAPTVAGLPERVLVLRDQRIGGVVEESSSGDGGRRDAPSLDLSLNYVPILYPLYQPALMLARPRQREFWRVLNASASTFFDLQLLYWPNPDTQIPQLMQAIAIDGVPVGGDFAPAERSSILLPPGARAEFLITTPPAGIYAQLLTQRYDNGPLGNTDSYRVLANIRSVANAPAAPGTMPGTPPSHGPRQFPGLTSLQPARRRVLYFSEETKDPAHPKRGISYFLTVAGATPKIFDMNFAKPDLTAMQGTVEDWTIENRTQESHAFHIHQLHFQLLERDGKPAVESALRDTIELRYWDGKRAMYPSVKIRMDFRDPNIAGTFLYHCHILEHEDGGMMGSIAVVPPAPARK
jgi:FtsP/CotA-like multicopper oxidase with cupredoxin domain